MEKFDCNSKTLVNDFDCIAIDAICLLNQMAKLTLVKPEKDLTSSFCNRVDELASTILVAFDMYKGLPLKDTRKKRQIKEVPHKYEITLSSYLSKSTMRLVNAQFYNTIDGCPLSFSIS